MKRDIKMIAVDLDRTLLHEDETLSQVTVEAIRYARAKGILFVIATARSFHSAMSVARQLSPDALIHTGGAYAVVGDQVIYRAVLSSEATREAARICLDAPFVDHIRICGELEDITTNPAVSVGELEFGHYRRVSLEELPEALCQPATKITVCTSDHQALTDLLSNDERFAVTISHNTGSFGHKIAHPAAAKEAALHRVAAHFGITCGEIMAFGDDMADVGMLAVCGLGVAVENATPEVKAVADVVCRNADEDGVAHYINEFFG